MNRTRGLSPKVLGPLVTALSALAVAKIHDPAVQGFVVSLIGVGAAYALPPGAVSPAGETDHELDDRPDGDQSSIDTVTSEWHEGATTRPDPPTVGDVTP